MKDQLAAALAFAREVLRAEGLTAAGRVNLITVFGALIVTIGAGLLDVWQALVRTWNSDYETGLPPVLTLFVLFLVAGFLCVVVLALVPPDRHEE